MAWSPYHDRVRLLFRLILLSMMSQTCLAQATVTSEAEGTSNDTTIIKIGETTLMLKNVWTE